MAHIVFLCVQFLLVNVRDGAKLITQSDAAIIFVNKNCLEIF